MTEIVYPALFDTIFGPTMSLTEVAALGTLGTNWINLFTTAENYQWIGNAQSGANLPGIDARNAQYGYYYGRDICYWSFYKMGGYTNPTYLDRGLAWSLDYYNGYYGPNPGIQEWIHMGKSMALL